MGDVPSLIASAVVLLATVGTGLKWVLGKVDDRIKASDEMYAQRIKASQEDAEEARNKLEDRFTAEIKSLQCELASVRNDLRLSLELNNLFRNRIYQLENLIHKVPGVEIPDMQGWPPR